MNQPLDVSQSTLDEYMPDRLDLNELYVSLYAKAVAVALRSELSGSLL
jgi:hypothetical protein